MSFREAVRADGSNTRSLIDFVSRIIPDIRLLPGLAWIVIVLGGSLLTMFLYSFMQNPLAGDFTITFEYYRRFFESQLYQSIMIDSLMIATKTTIATLLIGYPIAYYIAIYSNHRNLLILLIIAPIWVFDVIRYYAWMLILGKNGIVNWMLVDVLRLFQEPLRLINTEFAVVIGLVNPLLPYMVIPIVASLISIDFSEIEAAKNLGATKLQAFYEVTLPQTKTGIAAGVTFVFILSSGAFLAPVLLGGVENHMIANIIGTMFYEGQNWNFGAVLAIVYSLLIVILFVVVGFIMDFDFSGTVSMGDES